MENKEQQILSEIKNMMSSIRTQLELLDAKMAELQQCVDPEEFDNNPIELDLEVPEIPDAEPASVEPVSVSLEFDVTEEVPVEEAVADETGPEETEPEKDDIGSAAPVDDDDDLPFGDLPGIFDEPEPLISQVKSQPKKPAMIDAMSQKEAWRTDMPGSPVKDVRSAISLNDRIIFINYLFDEDPLEFQNVIVSINAMTSLEEAVIYVSEKFPQWDMNSELVYRFMMAVRRRLN